MVDLFQQLFSKMLAKAVNLGHLPGALLVSVIPLRGGRLLVRFAQTTTAFQDTVC